MGVRLGDIAAFLGARLKGDAELLIQGVAELASAGPSQLSFLSNPKYSSQLSPSRAGAVLLVEADAAKAGSRSLLLSENPYRDFARVAARFFWRRELPELGVHPLACISPKARVAASARVGAFCVVEDNAELDARAVLYPFCYIGYAARIGADCLLYPFAAVLEGCVLGKRVILQAGAVIGADGFGFAPDPPRSYVKIPQMGNAVLEDDVEVQANACVDRATFGSTVVGQGSKIDNLVQIAHNVQIGRHTVLAAQAGIAGSTVVGNWVTFAGQAAASEHIRVGDGAVVTGQAGLGKSIPPQSIYSGSPASPMLEHHRGLVEMQRLPQLKKRVKELEQRLAALEKRLQGS